MSYELILCVPKGTAHDETKCFGEVGVFESSVHLCRNDGIFIDVNSSLKASLKTSLHVFVAVQHGQRCVDAIARQVVGRGFVLSPSKRQISSLQSVKTERKLKTEFSSSQLKTQSSSEFFPVGCPSPISAVLASARPGCIPTSLSQQNHRNFRG